MISVSLVGGGRMARAILASVHSDPEFRIQGVLVRSEPGSPLPGSPDVYRDLSALLESDPKAVILDFSSPDDAKARIEAVALSGNPLVEGTTDLGAETGSALAEAAERIPVVVAPNTSAGIALLRKALRAVLETHGSKWDVSILDRHHRQKKDAPSGTARVLEAHIRASLPGSAPAVASFRQGGVAGEHSVYLVGEEEELVLTHRAFSRGVFARGALLAAAFAGKAAPGLYAMDDVLG